MQIKSKTVRGTKITFAVFSTQEAAEAMSLAGWTPSNVFHIRGGWAVVPASSPWEREA